jgi:hypothetical protein
MGGIEQFIFQLARGGERYEIESTVLFLSEHADDQVTQMDEHQPNRDQVDFQI